jgi:lysine-N-methylase
MEKYESLSEGYGAEILKSIDKEETPHFRLSENDRCPHLDGRGLCRIITELGEGFLCHICREHPRFYNDTPYGKEVGLGLSCEEAARIVLSSDSYANIVEIGESEDEEANFFFDPIPRRERIFSILSDRSRPYEERLAAIGEEYDVSTDMVTEERWKELLGDLEYLDEGNRELFSCYSPYKKTPAELEKQLERALAYFVYRHCTAAFDGEEFRASLGFCLFCERLVASVAPLCESIFDAARIVSEEIEYSEDNTEAVKSEFEYLS